MQGNEGKAFSIKLFIVVRVEGSSGTDVSEQHVSLKRKVRQSLETNQLICTV